MIKQESKSQPTHEQISARAYQLWEADGRPPGRDQEYWFQAVAHLSGSQPNASSAASGNRPGANPAANSTTAPSTSGTNGRSSAGGDSASKKNKPAGQSSGRRQPAFV